jgi:glycosyltransferase involved in cell wall biosynthesis
MRRTVVHYTSAAVFGGAERALLTLCAGLDNSGWRQLLIHPAQGSEQIVQEAAALGIETLAMAQASHGARGQTLEGLRRLVRILKAEQAAVLHAHLHWPLRCTRGLAAGMLARTPAVIATQQLYRTLPLAMRLRQRALSHGVHRYIAVSQAMAQDMVRDRVVPRGKLRVIRNCVPVYGLRQASHLPLRGVLNDGADLPLVLSLARLNRQKGLRTLLEAASLVPDAIFVIAGEGPERAALEALCTELDLKKRVRLLGQRTDVSALLASCDLFVLPSLFEGLPLSILEAMAAGKPVIATAIPGTFEAVADGETALLAPPGDPVALACCIRRLLADPALATRLGQAGQVHVQEHFSAEGMTHQVEALYREVLEERWQRT